MTTSPAVSTATALADTRRWLERAVIGLNLCPFAKAVHVRGQIHWVVHEAPSADGDAEADLLQALLDEAGQLRALPPAARDTTLLIAPNMPSLADFLHFNAFVAHAERRLAKAGFGGVLQLASFHPRFEFTDADPDDIGNATNRAPYPTLHLLREDSVSHAVEAFPEAEVIFERNIATLEALGPAGWAALDVGPTR